METDRRQFLAAATSFAVSHALVGSVGFTQQIKPTRIVLLGTRVGPESAKQVEVIRQH